MHALGTINNSLIEIALRTISQGRSKIADLGAAGATGKRLIKDYTAGELVFNTYNKNRQSTVNAVRVACNEAVSYMTPVLDGLQEQLNLVQNALSLAIRASSDPTVQNIPQLASMNNQLMQILNQVQNVVNTTHDIRGTKVLNYAIAPYAASTVTQCLNQLEADRNAINSSIVDPIMIHGSIRNAALNVVGALIGPGAIIQANVGNPNVYGIVDPVHINAIQISLTNEYNTLVNITNNTNASPTTLTDASVQAMKIIPTIGFDAQTYITQQVNDCRRLEKLAALLPGVMVAAGVTGGGMAAIDVPLSIIASMTNQSVTSGNLVNGIHANHTQNSGGGANCAAFAALLTASEISALQALVTTPGTGLDVAGGHVIGAGPGQIQIDAIMTMLKQITCFSNVDNGTGNVLLAPGNTNSIIINSIAPDTRILSGTSIGGALMEWLLDGNGAGGGGTCVILAGQVVAGISPMDLVAQYLMDAARNFVNTTNAQIAAQGPEPIIQIGLLPTDTTQLTLPDTSTSIFGLNLDAISLSTVSSAAAAVISLQNAVQTLTGDIASINNQVNALTARIASLDVQDDILTDQIAEIELTDLSQNASNIAEANIQSLQAVSLVGTANVIKSTIDNAAQKILRRAIVGG